MHTHGRHSLTITNHNQAAPLEPEVQHLLTSSPPPLLRLSSYSSPSLLLTCSASGSPLPTFTWLKDGLPIAPTSPSSTGLGETVSTLRYVLQSYKPLCTMNMNRVPCPRQAVYTCVATSGGHTEEAHTRVLPTEPEGDGVGQWEEVEEPNLEEEGVCKEEVLTWASSLLVPEGELALLPCQAGEEVTWDRQGEPIEVLVLQPIEVLECPSNASCARNHLQLQLFPCIHNLK